MGEGRRTGVPFTLCPPAAESSRSDLDREKCRALRGMYHPIRMGMLMALLASAHNFQRGSGKGPASESDGASPPAFPHSAEEGASKQQPLKRRDSKKLFCDQDSNRLQDIHLHLLVFVLLTTLTLTLSLLSNKIT
ncbi:hypothetical protein DUI87_23456 [Hirundo rustica rustica]|uniref:Uncharacterized protein n=1 Tax=Hirundo rustica rustica TaxID=333673 RepID=A0A3M0JYN1_HIRRU|nr:hypothetical protein DUI87_23456 [Hirundo rustica rustica]